MLPATLDRLKVYRAKQGKRHKKLRRQHWHAYRMVSNLYWYKWLVKRYPATPVAWAKPVNAYTPIPTGLGPKKTALTFNSFNTPASSRNSQHSGATTTHPRAEQCSRKALDGRHTQRPRKSTDTMKIFENTECEPRLHVSWSLRLHYDKLRQFWHKLLKNTSMTICNIKRKYKCPLFLLQLLTTFNLSTIKIVCRKNPLIHVVIRHHKQRSGKPHGSNLITINYG